MQEFAEMQHWKKADARQAVRADQSPDVPTPNYTYLIFSWWVFKSQLPSSSQYKSEIISIKCINIPSTFSLKSAQITLYSLYTTAYIVSLVS